MSALPPEVEDIRQRTRTFIREVVVPSEPRPGATLDEAVLADLQARAKTAGVFAPHVPTEWGGLGVPIQQGLRTNDRDLILLGAVPAAGLALVVQGVFELLERAVVPRGLR